MFSRHEASRIRQEFWTTFGQYMRPVLPAAGLKVNWVNYHTRVKDVYFRLDAAGRHASISISIEHADPEIQQLYFEQFLELKAMLEVYTGEEWTWQLHTSNNEGRIISRISKSIQNGSVMNRED